MHRTTALVKQEIGSLYHAVIRTIVDNAGEEVPSMLICWTPGEAQFVSDVSLSAAATAINTFMTRVDDKVRVSELINPAHARASALMPSLQRAIIDILKELTGEHVFFSLFLFTDVRACYVGNISRDSLFQILPEFVSDALQAGNANLVSVVQSVSTVH